MKILLTGAEGQVGKACQKLWQDLPSHLCSLCGDVLAVGRDELDITVRTQVLDYVQQERPNVVINCAAYTAVDKAEQDENNANAVNHLGPKYLAEACQSVGAIMVHISTDYVYEPPLNDQPFKAFRETDHCSPINIYGKTKLLGENAVIAACEQSVIIRTAWIFSADGNNFVKTMLRLAKEREELSVVCDQMGCPTYADDIAEAIATLLQHANNKNSNPESRIWGVYNYCGDIGVTWHEFARQIFTFAFQQGILSATPVLSGIPTESYPTPAERPRYSVMDTQKIMLLGVTASPWRQRLSELIARLS